MKDKNASHERGQSLVEMALMLPLLLIVMIGAIDLGRIFYGYITITNAAREGARYGATSPFNDTAIKNAAVEEANASGFSISPDNVSVPTHGIEPGDPLTVEIAVDYPLVTSFLIGGASVRLGNSATMAILQGAGD